jgi:hypothetical protein
MLRSFSQACWLVGFFALAACAANAQEVVHALSGVVYSVNPTRKIIDIKTDDGSEGLFKDLTNSSVSLDFDKDVRADSTLAGDFNKKGANVIVYYFGDSDERTVVALKDLGQGPLKKINGSVTEFNKHERLLTVKDASGAIKSFQIGPQTVAETAVGAVEGDKYDPEKGDQVRVVATLANGKAEALFIRAK